CTDNIYPLIHDTQVYHTHMHKHTHTPTPVSGKHTQTPPTRTHTYVSLSQTLIPRHTNPNTHFSTRHIKRGGGLELQIRLLLLCGRVGKENKCVSLCVCVCVCVCVFTFLT